MLVALAKWANRATFSPQHWALPFMVTLAGEAVGTQDLRADDFPALGCIETGSCTKRHLRRGVPAVQIRFQIEREQWHSQERPRGEVEGVEACREMLGVVSGR